MLTREVEELEVDSFFVRFLSGVAWLAPAEYALLLQLMPSSGAAGALEAYEPLAASGRVDGFLITDPELEDPRFPSSRRPGCRWWSPGVPIRGPRSRGWRPIMTAA